jgi:putative oxidoreductase
MTLKDCELWLAPYAPQILSILRIMVALLLFQHAFSKFFGFPARMPTPAPFSLIWFAGMIELIAGALLLLGLFTRIAAFILSGEMAFAHFIGHAPKGFYPLTNGGESAVLFCFIFLCLAAAEGGAWSLDALRGKA